MTKETPTRWEETIPELTIELVEDGTLLLTHKDTYGNGDDMVSVHPMHLRFMAEKLGLVNTMTDTEARALQMVDKLTRRMGVLHERIKQVRDWMWQNSERGFDDCDINIEAWYSDATLDISNEFMAEIDEYRALLAPKAPPIPPLGEASRRDNTPHSVQQGLL